MSNYRNSSNTNPSRSGSGQNQGSPGSRSNSSRSSSGSPSLGNNYTYRSNTGGEPGMLSGLGMGYERPPVNPLLRESTPGRLDIQPGYVASGDYRGSAASRNPDSLTLGQGPSSTHAQRSSSQSTQRSSSQSSLPQGQGSPHRQASQQSAGSQSQSQRESRAVLERGASNLSPDSQRSSRDRLQDALGKGKSKDNSKK
ncbi:hypothetical protein BJX99DRAFT_264539 [Aspergillus californicus]